MYEVGSIVRIKDNGSIGVVEREEVWGGGVQILAIRTLSGNLWSRDDSEVEAAGDTEAHEFVSDVKTLVRWTTEHRLSRAAELVSARPAPLSPMIILPNREVGCSMCGLRWGTIIESLDHNHFAPAE